ncbi:MAG TPA: succinate dehydrogenase cytochrome b subunit [Gemmatimonadaceae bacterium]|nr:succinate dehydrogenase cytochrome b subunit [Gemmatimonadaceae bacterium]
MNRASRFYKSAIGKKVVMGITGLIGIGFVIGHMAGNLLVFRGPDAINSYSHFLKSTGELLWIVRLVLIGAVIVHVIAAVQLTLQNRAARPIGYVRRTPQVTTLASRTMRWGGVILLIFIPLHILHFTTGTIQPAGVFSATDVFGNIIASFRIWWVALFYVIAMISLGLHLYHGAWSSLRSLGYAHPSRDPLKRQIALAVAAVLWLGFTAVPVAVFAGLIG